MDGRGHSAGELASMLDIVCVGVAPLNPPEPPERADGIPSRVTGFSNDGHLILLHDFP